MKILITSGGTSEKIDKVRSITNHSTGQLGKVIAEYYLAKSHDVTLVTTKHAVKPEHHNNLKIHFISNVASLIETLEPLVRTHDVIIHSMAVSDYTPVYMTDLTEIDQMSSVTELLEKHNLEGKISSVSEHQVLLLKKTPKVISLIKKWNPNIRLIGFKLLVDVTTEHLISIAKESLIKNHADMIVANDLTQISDNDHVAYLVEQDTITQVLTKQEIAKTLYERIQEK